MRIKISPIVAVITCLAFAGCADLKARAADVKEHVVDFPKAVWGNSTRALEEARVEAISQTFMCAYDDCFNTVLALGEAWNEPKVVEERENTVLTGLPLPDPGQSPASSEDADGETIEVKKLPFTVYFHDRAKGHIVVIAVPGSVDTTEAGIFFDKVQDGIKVDVSSLSSHAKRTVAGSIFKELSAKFGAEGK